MIQISIIVPIYNVEKCLRRCIDSILNQTFKDFELILVNDGSTDKCEEICDEYAKKDNRIIVIHKENGGLSSARNAGLDIAKGKYIGFVDSDDYIHSEMYSTLKYELEKNDSDIVICGYKDIFDLEANFYEVLNLNYRVENYNSFECIKGIYHNNKVNFIVAWNKLYKRELFNKIRYPINRIYEDAFIAPELIYKSKKISFIDNKYYYYYIREDSITRSKFSMKNIDEIYLRVERIKFLKRIREKELLDYEVNFFINSFFYIYYKAKCELNIEKRDLRKIKKLFLKTYITILRSKRLNYKEKIVMIKFIINDNWYNKVNNK